MGAEEAFEFVDNLVFLETGQHLDKTQRIILCDLWEHERRTYQEIAEHHNYTEAHIKSVGAGLWNLLTKVLGQRVSKSSFQIIIEGLRRNQQTHNICFSNSQPQELDSNFVGRDREIAEMHTLVKQGARAILIQGEGGVGKTTLARRYFKTHGFYFLNLWMAQDSQDIVPVESVVEEWLRGDFHEEPGREFGINLERLRRKLRDGTRKIGVLIDNLESALDKNGQIIASRRLYVELLRVLADPTIQSVTLITSREPLCEAGVDVSLYSLKGLHASAWEQFFTSCQINFHTNLISEICKAFGGNAKAMKIISGAIKKDFEGNADVYWRENRDDLLIERELRNLVKSQFNRLEQLDNDAYRLLCRLGCYRYQEMTHVSIQGLQCLLWDIPEPQARRVIKSLTDRSLVEHRRGKYWLHPVICTEAIARLGQNGEWQIANRKAADFWTASVTQIEEPQDTSMALEAYYHYIEIGDFEQAANVIIRDRNNKWDKSLALGVLFSRFGLLEKLISVITPLIQNLNSDYHLTILYNMLGRAYHQTGNIKSAIECHQNSDKIAEKYAALQEKISSKFNLGLCYIDLWETETAANIFQAVKQLAESQINYSQYVIYCQCCLAYLDSHLDRRESALARLRVVTAQMSNEKLTAWGIGTSLLYSSLTYTNLDYLDIAKEICHQAIIHCQRNQFTSLEARAISCLASLYRQQGEFELAIKKHSEAINSMSKLSEKCNLAKAYYQMGITYQTMGELTRSRANFHQAIALFNNIPAPQQVERVKRAMQ